MSGKGEDDGRWYDRIFDSETVNYVAAWITIVVSITSAAFTVFLAYRLFEVNPADEKSHLDLLIVPSISTLLLLIVLTLVSFSYRRKLIRIGQKDATIARLTAQLADGVRLNNDISKHRTLIARAHYEFCSLLRTEAGKANQEKLPLELQMYLDLVLDNTSKLFTIYTNDSCSACVKILSKDAQGKSSGDGDSAPGEFISTLRRDPGSRQLRHVVDTTADCGVYQYKENAAFFNIVDRRTDFFIHNDLKGLGTGYWNKSKDWAKRYNATAVVPIKKPESVAQDQCAAMLCVDNLKGGFDSDRCKWILEGIAIDLYYALRTYLILVSQMQSGTAHA